MIEDIQIKDGEKYCTFSHTGDNYWELSDSKAPAQFLMHSLIAFVQRIRPNTVCVSFDKIIEHPVASDVDFDQKFPGYIVKSHSGYMSIESIKMIKMIGSLTTK